MNLPIFLDMDEVICNFLGKLIDIYNNKYNKNIYIQDIKTWSLLEYIGEEGIKIFKQPGFFADLQPIQNSLEIINLLQSEGRETYIISSPVNEYCVFDKYKWIQKHLPKFPIGNLILVGNKGNLLSKIDKGILLDDCPSYLSRFCGTSVAMDMPYNQLIECDYRVEYWDDFYDLVKGI